MKMPKCFNRPLKILVGLLFAALLLTGCTKEDETQRILTSQGFTGVNVTGYRFFGCDEKDFFHTGFIATSPNGQRVEGVVCAGWLKGSTVRFD